MVHWFYIEAFLMSDDDLLAEAKQFVENLDIDLINMDEDNDERDMLDLGDTWGKLFEFAELIRVWTQ